MKLASLKRGGRDGELVVVSRAMDRCVSAVAVAPTMQAALDDWARLEPKLRQLEAALETQERWGEPFDPADVCAPLPRAYHWADGSAFVHHVELVRRARGVELPSSFWSEPLIYQGGSDDLQGARDPIVVNDEASDPDFEAEIAVITDEVQAGATEKDAAQRIRLITLVNDVTLRGLIPAELAKGFGFYQSKPATSFSPVAVTPDELGDAWLSGRLHLQLLVHLNGRLFGRPNAGCDMNFSFPQLIAHAATTRRLGAGTIVGSGTVSNRVDPLGLALADGGVGHCCIAEQRMVETIVSGAPRTPFLRGGDVVRIEMLDPVGRSVFGAIEQVVAIRGSGGRMSARVTS